MGQQRPETTMVRRGVQWWIGPDCELERANQLLDAALEAVDGDLAPEINGRRKERYLLALTGDQPDHLLKVSYYDRGSSWTQRLRTSKAMREFHIARDLRSRGIDAPAPLAGGEQRRRGLLYRSFLLLPYDGAAIDLAEYARSATSARERNRVAAGLGALARQLHDAGLRQPDFAPNNFLLRSRDPVEIVPIDFERAAIDTRSDGAPRSERLTMLAKLQRHLSGATPAARMRFLTAYADDSDTARALWRDVSAAIAALAWQDHKRLVRVATSDGRRFESAEFDGWTGWARRDSARFEVACELLTREKTRSEPPLRIESRGGAWALAYRKGREPSAADIWATAQVLWNRGLVPQPICALRRNRDFRVYFERDADARGIAGPSAQAAITVMLDRLLGLGSLSSKLTRESIHTQVGPDGVVRAVLIDIALFRLGRVRLEKARDTARAMCAKLRA